MIDVLSGKEVELREIEDMITTKKGKFYRLKGENVWREYK